MDLKINIKDRQILLDVIGKLAVGNPLLVSDVQNSLKILKDLKHVEDIKNGKQRDKK